MVDFLQGDVKFAEVLEKMGCKVSWTENSVTVTGPPRVAPGRKHLHAIDVNMNKMPDVAMTLAVVALYADGPTAIRDGMPSSTLCCEPQTHFLTWLGILVLCLHSHQALDSSTS